MIRRLGFIPNKVIPRQKTSTGKQLDRRPRQDTDWLIDSIKFTDWLIDLIKQPELSCSKGASQTGKGKFSLGDARLIAVLTERTRIPTQSKCSPPWPGGAVSFRPLGQHQHTEWPVPCWISLSTLSLYLSLSLLASYGEYEYLMAG